MKTFVKRFPMIAFAIILFIIALPACKSSEEIAGTPSEVYITPTIATSTQAAPLDEAPTSTPFSLPTATSQPENKPTPPVIYPTLDPLLIGTSLPQSLEVISAGNVQYLRQVAQWGKGSILGLAYNPDGRSFVVGSAFGMAVYNLDDLQTPPEWIPFETPIQFDNLSFSQDGKYIRLAGYQTTQIIKYPDGAVVENVPDVGWPNLLIDSFPETVAYSSDNLLKFKSYIRMNEENMWDLTLIREIYNNQNGKLLYKLQDETTFVQYYDHHPPEGCDLASFSMCGNVYQPTVMSPYQVAFSPFNKSLAILYRPENLSDASDFSTLRIYDVKDGKFLLAIGGSDRPVAGFSYSPDGQKMLVGFVDGSIRLWDIQHKKDVFGATHFNSTVIKLGFTPDGKYLIVQRPHSIEVRLIRDGSLMKEFSAEAFAVSPVDSLLAVGDATGNIRIENLNSGKTLQRIQAHKDKIYALAFSTDGQMLTSSGQDCNVRSWDSFTGKFLHYFQENFTDAYQDIGLPDITRSRMFIYYMEFIPGTDQLIGYGSWSRVVSWNINSGATQYLIEPKALDYYNGMITLNPHFPGSFGIDPSNQSFYLEKIRYNTFTGKEEGEFQPMTSLSPGCSPFGSLSKDGKLLFSRGYDDREGQICILDASDQHLIQSVNPNSKVSKSTLRSSTIDWPYLSPDGKQLIYANPSGVIFVYEIAQ